MVKASEQSNQSQEHVRVYFSYINGLTSGTLKTIEFQGKTFRYLESSDGHIHPATFYQPTSLCSRELAFAAYRTRSTDRTYCYLEQDKN